MLDQKNKNNDSEEDDDMVEEVLEDFTMVEIPELEEEQGKEKTSEETEVVNPKAGQKPNFLTTFLAIVSDLLVIGVLSYACLYLIDFILRITAGFYIVEKNQMLAIIAVVVAILYMSILESTLGATVGKKIVNLKVVKE